MLPILFRIGPIPVFSYGLLIAVGFLVAVHFVRRDARRANLDPDLVTDGAFWVLFLGLVGTRVLHIILYPQFYSWSDPVGWIAVWKGGLVFQGALPPTIVFVIYFVRKHKIGFWKSVDITVPYIPLAHAFGRIGCFMNGCCYGKVTQLPWGLPFRRIQPPGALTPTGSPPYLDHVENLGLSEDAMWSYPVHPTQLYSVVGLLCIFFFYKWLTRRWHPFEGFALPYYLVAYGVFRFLVEFLRGDHNPTLFGEMLSTQQVFCLFMVAVGVGMYAVLRRRAGGGPEVVRS